MSISCLLFEKGEKKLGVKDSVEGAFEIEYAFFLLKSPDVRRTCMSVPKPRDPQFYTLRE